MKSTFLGKTLAIVLLTILLSAALTALVFRVTGADAYADIKCGELAPRVRFIASRTGDYLQGKISLWEYEQSINSKHNIWDAAPYVYLADGTLLGGTVYSDMEEDMALVNRYLSTVLAGESVSSAVVWGTAGVVVGEPIENVSGEIIGAAFLVKSIGEIQTAMNSLWTALLIAVVLVTAIMLIPVYLLSRKLTGPLLVMNQAALAMAHGDFSVRAHEAGNDEIAQLGRSLNYLSGALSHTIGDLTFERNKLRTTLDGLEEGVVTLDAQAAIVQHNTAAVRLLGGGEGAALESLPLYGSLLPKARETLADGAMRVAEHKNMDVIVRATLIPLRDSKEQIEGALLVVQDVTESVRLEQTRKDYVANVSHELRTPLAAIRSLADALGDGLVKKEGDRQRYYGYIQKETMRLSRLIDDLLELSRLQSGTIALTKQRMSVNELVYDVAERYESIARENGVSLTLDCPEDCPAAYGNPDRSEQMLIVLLDNAFKHGAGEGGVTLSVREAGEKLVISVSNPGEIAPEDLAHIFERFYKADRAHSGEGTGLGLSIASEIASLLDERISARSEGGRVTFSFTVGLYASEE